MLASLLIALASFDGEQVHHSYHPRTWYSDLLAGPAVCSPDGRFLSYTKEGQQVVVELASGEVVPLSERIGWDAVNWVRWAGDGSRLLAIGRDGGVAVDAAFDLQTGERSESGLWEQIFDVLCTSSPERRIVAGRHAGKLGLWLEEKGHAEPTRLTSRARKLAWAVAPDAGMLAVLLQNEKGWADLILADLQTGERRTLLADADASYQPTTMAFTADGSEILLSLVGVQRGSAQDKQDPDSDRDLDIFALDIASATLRSVVGGPGDDLVTGIVGGRLLWTNVITSMRIGIVPAAGGDVTELIGETASYPYWHPDGDRVSAMYGPMTIADWALNWDLGAMGVDSKGRSTGALEALIVGPHEDFALNWSPDGRWMAYHSHRGPKPAMAYSGGGATDDIWMRAADGGPEIQLSRNAGPEVCQPDWSPDGFEVMFVAIDQRAGRFRPVVVEIDPETGARVAQRNFLVPGIDGDVLSAVYSPVGPEVAFEERTRDGTHRLWVVSLESREKRLLAEFEALSEISGIDFGPNGESLLYVALHEEDQQGEHHALFRVATDGDSAPVRLTNVAEEIYTPQASPDGELIAVTIYTHTKSVKSKALE